MSWSESALMLSIGSTVLVDFSGKAYWNRPPTMPWVSAFSEFQKARCARTGSGMYLSSRKGAGVEILELPMVGLTAWKSRSSTERSAPLLPTHS